MLPLWAAAEGLTEWTCMDCTGETPRELIEWKQDARDAGNEQLQRESDAAFLEEQKSLLHDVL
jgi:hypothetical protein